MNRNFLLNSLIIIFLSFSGMRDGYSAETAKILKKQIQSPYEACKNYLIVPYEHYSENKDEWDALAKSCNQKIIKAQDIGITSLDPLMKGAEYLSFSQKVAAKVAGNLNKNRAYAECSASCFSGAKTCPAKNQAEVVQCDERKKTVQAAMKVFSRRIRTELALSHDSAGFTNVNVSNVLSVSKEKFINHDLREFEIGMPNPVGKSDLGERELKEAYRLLERDHKALENEFKEKGYTNYNDWMSVKKMENFEKHREKYRTLVYEEAPIFAVIDRPVKLKKNEHPVWTDDQMARAFLKLADNAKKTEQKVQWSIKNGTLEFSRTSTEAVGYWLSSLAGGSKEKNDLLYYIGMKNQVEEVLRSEPSLCGVATEMEARLRSKELQNSGTVLGASIASGGVLKLTTGIAGQMLRVGRALSLTEASILSGMGLGATLLYDSFVQYNTVTKEQFTRSGLDNNSESSGLRNASDVNQLRDNLKWSLVLAPLDTVGVWGLGKTVYASLAWKIARDMPEVGALIKSGKLPAASRDIIVDKWLSTKIDSAIQKKFLSDSDKGALKSKEGREVLEKLNEEIEKANPKFFKNPDNVDFFLKVAATTIKKQKDDLPDLGTKAKDLLLEFNADAMDGSWGPKAQAGLLKVFDNAIIELRTTARLDPATYAKFSSDPESRSLVFRNALKRSGVKDDELPSMVQCALPR